MTVDAPPRTEPATDRTVWSTEAVVLAVTVAAGIVFLLVSTSWRPWDLFDRAGFSSDFYDEQARAFLRGDLDVDPDVAGIEGFVVDGRTYFYYGPFLAIVRLPFMLFGDLFVGRLVRISMLVAFVVLCRWSARLAQAARAVLRSAGPNAADAATGDERWAVGVFTAAVAASPALFAAGWITVYHETELWALTLAVIALTLIVEWAAVGFVGRRRLVLAGAAALATTLTRAPIGFGVALALFLVGAVLVWRAHHAGGDTERPRTGGLAIALGGVPVVAHVAVNWAKFGTLLSVPGDRQVLSMLNPDRAAWFAGNDGSFFSPRFLPTTVVQYLRPDAIAFERLLPGIRFGPLATDRGSYPVESITPSSSLTVTATLLVVLALVGAVWLVRHRAATWLLLVACTTLGALPTFLIGFVANRYLIDMLPPLIVAGAIGCWLVMAWPWRRTVRVGAVVLALFGVWANASLATWTLEYRTVGFTEFRYDVDRALFGAPSPGLIVVDPANPGPVPRDGVVALDPECRAVHIAEQGRWLVLQRAIGPLRVDGVVGSDDGATVVATGDDWLVEVEGARSGEARVIVARPGVAVEERVATGPFGATIRYEVVVDPVSRESYVRLDDEVVLLPGDLGPIDAPSSPPSPLCLELVERLG